MAKSKRIPYRLSLEEASKEGKEKEEHKMERLN